MKLISLWEPWATLMAIGAKKIETRSWKTDYGGWLAIHASKGGLSKRELDQLMATEPFFSVLRGHQLCKGHIVAVVRLETCWPTGLIDIDRAFPGRLTDQERAFGDYSPGRYGWITRDLLRLPKPIPFSARQGLCNVPNDVMVELYNQFPRTDPTAPQTRFPFV